MEKENQPTSFPDKPELNEDEGVQSNILLKSIGSLFLFVIAFYIFFSKDITFILILVFVLFIHEMGHFIAMKHFGYKDVKMFFIPLLGALVSGEKEEISQRERVIITLAGPVPGIVIGLVIYFFGIGNDNHLLLTTSYLFIFINVFNLLPFIPFDGGRLIETLFFDVKETLQIIFLSLSAIGLTLIAIYLGFYILIIIPVFLLMRVFHQISLKKVRKALEEKQIDYNKPYNQLSNEEYWLIREQIVIIMEKAFNDVNPKDYTISKDETLILNQVNSLYTHSQNQDLTNGSKFKVFLFWLLFIIVPVYFANPLFSNLFVAELSEEEQFVEGCIVGFEIYPEMKEYISEIREFCKCYTQILFQNFTSEDIMLQMERLSEEEISELHTPYVENCIKKFEKSIPDE